MLLGLLLYLICTSLFVVVYTMDHSKHAAGIGAGGAHGMHMAMTTTMSPMHQHPTAATTMPHHVMDDGALVDQVVDHSAAAAANAHSGHGAGAAAANSGHSMMKMYFHWGYDEVILFDFWRISSQTGLILSCLGLFLMSVLYEGVKWFRLYLEQRKNFQDICQNKNGVDGPADRSYGTTAATSATLAPTNGERLISANTSNDDVTIVRSPPEEGAVRTLRKRPAVFGWFQLVEAVLYMVQLVLAYLLMLVFMTYNLWLCAAVIAGCGVGHLLFARTLSSRHIVNSPTETYLSDCCH